MGREVRKVPENWEHPKDHTGHYLSLLNGYSKQAEDFLSKAIAEGLQSALDYFGDAPDKKDYMPEWSAEEATHLMMYEICSEGTPLSPAFPTPEQLARWLVDNEVSAGGRATATYDQWLTMIKEGWAPSFVCTPETGLISGVEAASLVSRKEAP